MTVQSSGGRSDHRTQLSSIGREESAPPLVQIVIFDDPDASFLPAASFHGDVESQQTGCPSEGEGIWRAKSAAG